MKKRVMIVFGTRPEAIKMAPLIRTLRRSADLYEVSVCVTGQHREMLDQVMALFDITPDHDLDIMRAGQDLYDVTARILLGMKEVLENVKPHIVLVHGDTVTSFASALAAFYQKIPIGHVEAGLRTYDRYSPWPEEINRQLTSRLATYHFAPTVVAQKNLLSEQVKESSIVVTGNTVIDALHDAVGKINGNRVTEGALTATLAEHGYDINRLNQDRRLIVITGHRRENFGDGFSAICQAIKQLAEQYPAVDFVYPVHLNPNVQTPVRAILKQPANGNVFLIAPLAYLPFIYLMKKSYLLLTDSGGIQEEAPGLGKPVLVMRNTTERPEALEAGTIKLIGANVKTIVLHVSELLDKEQEYQRMTTAQNPYGDGRASERIAAYLTDIPLSELANFQQ